MRIRAEGKGENPRLDMLHPTIKYLHDLPNPPRIMGIQMIFFIKGQRGQDDYDGKWKTRNHLLYGWRREGIAEPEYAWRWKWSGPEVNDKTGKLVGHTFGKGWRMFSVFDDDEVGGVKGWIDMLASGTVQPDAGNPFDGVVYTPLPYFRQDRDMQDWYEQTFNMEADYYGRVRAVESVRQHQPEMFRHALNSMIPQNRQSCDWPGKCSCIDICFSDDSMLVNPTATGLYRIRQAHHVAEAAGRK